MEKASPLTAMQAAAFSKLADNQTSLSANLSSFCSISNMLCYSDVSQKNVGASSSTFTTKDMLPLFFREDMIQSGKIMLIPDLGDKMPKRSFLPGEIVRKLPFSMLELKKIFHAEDNSSMASIISNALNDCERRPSEGELKRCVQSVEDMIDFATFTLGRNVGVRTTTNTNGSGMKVVIGRLTKSNGGQITMSISCHQLLFP